MPLLFDYRTMITPAPMNFDPGEDAKKLTVLGVILVVSLFAVSFPGLSQHAPFLRIPKIIFFIGKHFGTGVILATAFIHLLSDAFSSLQKDEVTKRYGPVGRWTGLIILGSLLAIFLVEYISTLVVEHLNEQPSAPPTPVISRAASVHIPVINPDENTPLLVAHHPAVLPAMVQNGVPVELLAGSPRVCRLSIISHHSFEALKPPVEAEDYAPKIGRKRQVIGILVLQLGIMIHSLVIGMALVVTSGSDFASLTTAIIFHQLFEGLSLGIRIAALPPARHSEDATEDTREAQPRRLSPRGSSLPKWLYPRRILQRCTAWLRHLHWLKPTLAISFGLTTPFGMCLGMLIWDTGNRQGKDKAAMSLLQGLMSAVSAGLLIYASTVEMLAGDFVFGDVDGGHQHHHHSHEGDSDVAHEHTKGHVHTHESSHQHDHSHGHGHEHEHDHDHRQEHRQHAHRHTQSNTLRTTRAHRFSHSFVAQNEVTDPPPVASSFAARIPRPQAEALPECREGAHDQSDSSLSEEHFEGEISASPKASLQKRLLALGSLFAGVLMMVVVGLGE